MKLISWHLFTFYCSVSERRSWEMKETSCWQICSNTLILVCLYRKLCGVENCAMRSFLCHFDFSFNYIWSFVASDSIVLIGVVDRHFTSIPAIQCPIEELCQVWFNNTDSCCWMEYVNHTGKQFWNNLIVFRLGVEEKLQMFCTVYGQLVQTSLYSLQILSRHRMIYQKPL